VGKVLVKHALLRIAGLADDWGCAAVVTDPIDDRARNLDRGFDFEPLRGGSNRMIVATKNNSRRNRALPNARLTAVRVRPTIFRRGRTASLAIVG
jgi:hypothetical protein